MLMIEPGSAYFEADLEYGFKLSFTAPDHGRTGSPRRALLVIEYADRAKLFAAAAWFGQRQDLWERWRKLAEEEGPEALSRDLATSASSARIEGWDCTSPRSDEFVAVHVRPGGRGDDIEIVAELRSGNFRIIRHVFRSPAHRRAFLGWLDLAGPEEPADLGLLGLTRGRSMLGRVLDEIAALTGDEDHAHLTRG